MSRVAVIYHSKFGNTQVMAEEIARGAADSGAQAQLFSVDAVDWQALDDADAILFGAPTYMGSASAAFKQFMDDTSPVWMRQGWKDKYAAGFTSSGSPSGDKLNVLVQLCLFAAQHSMIWIGTGTMPSGKTPDDVNRLGSFLGAMAQSDSKQPLCDGDRRTAYLLGARVAQLASTKKQA